MNTHVNAKCPTEALYGPCEYDLVSYLEFKKRLTGRRTKYGRATYSTEQSDTKGQSLLTDSEVR